MLQPNITANPATLALLAACVLGIGFMLRFLFALTGEENKMQVVRQVRFRSIHYAKDSTSDLRQRGGVAADPAAYLAMGALRITTALASTKPSRARRGSVKCSDVWRTRARLRNRTLLSLALGFGSDWRR